MSTELAFKGYDRESDSMVFSASVGLEQFFHLVEDGRIDINAIKQLVCLDKNGDKVFAGDDVKAYFQSTELCAGEKTYDEGQLWWDKNMLLWRLAIKGKKYEKKWFGRFYDQIELIKEDT